MTESNHNKAKFAEQAPSMCPVLNAMVEEDWIEPSGAQRVALSEIRDALSHMAMGPTLKMMLTVGPLFANRKKDYKRNLATWSFSLPRLHGGFFDHEACSSSVHDDKFEPKKFDETFGRAADNTDGYVNIRTLAWVLYYNLIDPTLKDLGERKPKKHEKMTEKLIKGFLLSNMELSAMLNTFGRKNDNGEIWMSLEGVRGLYASGTVPEGWGPNRMTGLRDLVVTMSRVATELLEILRPLEVALRKL